MKGNMFFIMIGVILFGSPILFADGGQEERVIGPVIAVERRMPLTLEACNERFERTINEMNYIQLQCEVNVFPDSDEEEELSSFLGNEPHSRTRVLLRRLRGTDINLDLLTSENGYILTTNSLHLDYYPEMRDLPKEEFLNAARTLIDRFPVVSVKVLKVAR